MQHAGREGGYQQTAMGEVASMMLTKTLAMTHVTCAHRDARHEFNGHVAPAHSPRLRAGAGTVLLPDLVEVVQLWRLPGTSLPPPTSPRPLLPPCLPIPFLKRTHPLSFSLARSRSYACRRV